MEKKEMISLNSFKDGFEKLETLDQKINFLSENEMSKLAGGAGCYSNVTCGCEVMQVCQCERDCMYECNPNSPPDEYFCPPVSNCRTVT